MKGIIVDYFEENGFGFIKDENEDKRFFHISSLINKDIFLNNIVDYFFTDWIDRKCYVITFEPSENEKGLSALNIELTNQVFNDNRSVIEFEAKVIDLKYDTASLTRTVSGISKGMSKPVGATTGGNGTYRIGYPQTLRELNIYFRRIDNIGWGTINVRDLVLTINNRSKLTDKFIQTLKNHLIEKTIKVVPNRTNWILNETFILKI